MLLQRQGMNESPEVEDNPHASAFLADIKEEPDATKPDKDDPSPPAPACYEGIRRKGSRPWKVLISSWIIQVLTFGVFHVYGLFYVDFMNDADLDATPAKAALVGSLAYGLCFLLSPLTSILCASYGYRVVAGAGAILCGASLLASSFVKKFNLLFASFSLLYGIGSSLSCSTTLNIVEDYFDEYKGLAMGMVLSGTSCGSAILAPIVYTLLKEYQRKWTFQMLGIGFLLSFASTYAFKPTHRIPPHLVAHRRRLSIRKVLRKKPFMMYVLGIAISSFGFLVPYIHIANYGGEIASGDSYVLILLLGVSSTIGRIFFAFISKSKYLSAFHMQQSSIILMGTGSVLLFLITEFDVLILYVIMYGFVEGCWLILIPMQVSVLVSNTHKPVGLGVLALVCSVPLTLGPVLVAYLEGETGDYNLSFHIAGFTSILGGIMIFMVPWINGSNTRRLSFGHSLGENSSHPKSNIASAQKYQYVVVKIPSREVIVSIPFQPKSGIVHSNIETNVTESMSKTTVTKNQAHIAESPQEHSSQEMLHVINEDQDYLTAQQNKSRHSSISSSQKVSDKALTKKPSQQLSWSGLKSQISPVRKRTHSDSQEPGFLNGRFFGKKLETTISNDHISEVNQSEISQLSIGRRSNKDEGSVTLQLKESSVDRSLNQMSSTSTNRLASNVKRKSTIASIPLDIVDVENIAYEAGVNNYDNDEFDKICDGPKHT